MTSQADATTARVQALIRFEHRRLDPAGQHAEPSEISRVAAKLARRFFDPILAADRESIMQVRIAANLVYAMELYRLPFERVYELTSLEVAYVVSGLSSDVTLPAGPRRNLHISRLSAAIPESQIVKLAELHCTARRILGASPAARAPHVGALRAWADHGLCLLGVMTHLKPAVRMASAMTRVEARLKQVMSLAPDGTLSAAGSRRQGAR
jgi:hypothetical protein